MKTLIVGLGSIGRRHLRNLLALEPNSQVLLARTGRATLPDADLAGLPVETDYSKALAWGPQAVIIANPTALHLETAIPAARQGCTLLLEKPISHSMSRVDELVEAAQASGSPVLVGYQFRFHPGLQTAARLLSEGAIGRPLSAHAHWGEYLPDWHPWEDYRRGYSARPDLGGGVVLTLSHPLDYLRYLLGEVAAASAFIGKPGELELKVEDNAEILLRFQSGVTAAVHLDYNQRPPEHRLAVVGTQGTLRWENENGAVTVDTPAGRQTFPAPEGFERNHLFMAEMQHFLAVAHHQAAPLCTLEDGVKALRLSLAALDSARRGQAIDL
jgi:predicted dehydrogenase